MSLHQEKIQPKVTNGYARIWRWHFYSGIFVAPFLIMLAVTGMLMILLAHLDGRDGERITVTPQGAPKAVSVQAQAAVNAVDGGVLKQYIAPRSHEMVAVFRVDVGDKANLVAVDPYTATAVDVYPRRQGLYQLMDDIHGTLLLGKTGDFFIEMAASLSVLMIVTGLYLWWMRQRSVKKVLLPTLGEKTTWWRNTHGATGIWISIILLFFLISGLAWAGIWGGKVVQPWGSFPAEKSYRNQKSDLSHAAVLNDGVKNVPWALELTPMPISKKDASNDAGNKAAIANMDTLDNYARDHGFVGRYQLHFPKGETGVWTFTQNSMSYDSSSPTADRTVHLDQYSGELLADVRYEDYGPMAKFMAVGIALHIGTLGWWSVAANVIFCIAVIFMSIGGFVLWWKRRPSKSVGLAPPQAKSSTIGVGFAIILLVLAATVPLALLAIIGMFALDFLLFSRADVIGRYVK